jgi:hypothetical protein
MRLVLSRFIAVLLLVIPGIGAAYGFLQIKNTLFDYFASFGPADPDPAFNWLRFIFGLVLFLGGVGFIGGWIFFRDRKRNYVAPRFRKKRPRPPKPVRQTDNGTT